MPQISIIVATYNDPQALALILQALQRQTTQPHEIVFADDGSSAETGELISIFGKKSKIPLRHIWHEDKSHRKGIIVDKAVAAAKGDYLMFLDGDSIPHAKWVADHLYMAQPGRVLCGRRVRLGPMITQRIRKGEIEVESLQSFPWTLLRSAIQGDSKRYLLGLRWPAVLSRLRYHAEKRLMGVNYSLYRADFEKAGGHGEWDQRREDAELEIRLLEAGMYRYPLIHRGIVYHLYHPAVRKNYTLDQALVKRYKQALKVRERRVREAFIIENKGLRCRGTDE